MLRSLLRRFAVRFVVIAAALAPLGFAGCSSDSRPAATSSEVAYLNMDPSVEYVGADVCAKCHRENYETYSVSEMGRSFKKATLENSHADFTAPKPVYDPHRNFYYQAFHKDAELFIKEFRLERGDTTHLRIEKIDYIVGSGQHTNSHIMDVNGFLFQMPLTWYVQEQKWDLPPGFEDGANKRFDRLIEVECMSCHNATPDYVPASGNRYRHVPEGIDCERCHGPGQLHVEAIEAGKVVDIEKEIDYTIVNPGKLEPDLQFDVCQRCHLQGTAIPVEGKSFLDFRPGMRLSDVLKVFQPRYADSLEQFIMASHPDRLRMSECFVRSRAGSQSAASMTCITCHDPHVSIKSMQVESYKEACASCHTERQVPECTESIETRNLNGDNCASCHMPESASKDIPHVRITDHFIRVPDRVTPAQLDRQKKFVQLASLTDSRPTAEVMAQGYLTHYEQFEHDKQFLDSAAVFLARALKSQSERALVQPLVRLWFLQGDYGRVTGIAESIDAVTNVTDSWTLYRIGESYAKVGNIRSAINYFERAVAAAPDHLQFRTKLGTTYAADRQFERAVQVFDSVIEDDPKWSEAYNNRGFTHALMGDFEQAERDLVISLKLNPDFQQALGNLASLYVNTSRPEKARPYLERLMRIDPENANYRRLYDLL